MFTIENNFWKFCDPSFYDRYLIQKHFQCSLFFNVFDKHLTDLKLIDSAEECEANSIALLDYSVLKSSDTQNFYSKQAEQSSFSQ